MVDVNIVWLLATARIYVPFIHAFCGERATGTRRRARQQFSRAKEHDGAATVFDRADSALYRAKQGGKNLCVAA
jgi:GGDEF domain-containing protein